MADQRFVTSQNFNDVAKIGLNRKCRQQLHVRDVSSLAAFCFCPLEEKIVNKLCFPRFKLCLHPFPDLISMLTN